ncbi:MAG: hypothetical protein WCO29_22660 [Nostocales cyanobacterium ELA583]
MVEFVVREALQKSQRVISRLYDGNPNRATARPSAEQLRLFLIFNDRYFF